MCVIRAGWTDLNRKLYIYVLIALLIHSRMVAAVRCYCTEKSCEPFGYCESQWCVVGIRKSTGTVIRSCGTDQAYMLRICRRDLGDWQDLCACGDELCNSYAYLRTQIRHNRYVTVGDGAEQKDLPSYVRQSFESGAESPSASVNLPEVRPPPQQRPEHKLNDQLSGIDHHQIPPYSSRTSNQNQPASSQQHQIPPPSAGRPGDDAITFTRVDGPKHGRKYKQDGDRNDHVHGPDGHKGIVFERNSLLVILLVVVPLGIGALSVLIVASNYYCQLC